MPYVPSHRLFRLALTLGEMAQDLELGLRTTERLRDTLADMFPQLENSDDDTRVRWGSA